MFNDPAFEEYSIARVLETGEHEPVAWQRACPDCENDINDGDSVYIIDGKEVCKECFLEWLADYASTNPREVADALSVGWRLQQ